MGNAFIVHHKQDIPSNTGKKYNFHAVRTTTLAKALPYVTKINVLRMDAEGSEILVINGAHDLIANSANLKIIMEWSNHSLSKYGDPNELIAYLTAQQFRFWKISATGLIEKAPYEMQQLTGFHEIYLSRTAPATIAMNSYPSRLKVFGIP